MNDGTPELDPITLEILANALRSVTDETFAALMRSAYSTNIKERHDHSTTIMDRRGRLVVQAHQSLPIHLASMWGLMEALLAKYPEDEIHEGDLFVANDPFVAGGTHLPDVNLAMPVFADGELTAFVCNIAHHADIGGMAPGSMAGGMSEIFQEGLRIPVLKLFRRGELQQDLLDLLLLNVRVPEERRGDYFAQIAASRLGVRRLAEVIASHGRAVVEAGFEQIIARTERRMRDAIGALPDGSYRFRDVMDGDGLEAFDIPIQVEVTVRGSASASTSPAPRLRCRAASTSP
jgi:N-methylhydantoinase B